MLAAQSKDHSTPVFWPTHGFVVIQPTFLDSKTLSPK